MKDYITIGSSPSGEDCAQVGSADYFSKAMKECRAFRAQLIRVFGDEPEQAKLVIKSFPHDFGTYHEVCVLYEDTVPEAVEYAFLLEGDTPEYWDIEAIRKLGKEYMEKDMKDFNEGRKV